jgi:hypothetical protein
LAPSPLFPGLRLAIGNTRTGTFPVQLRHRKTLARLSSGSSSKSDASNALRKLVTIKYRNRRRSSCALSSDGFDFDDDAEMEESENRDAEDDVLDDEVCV